MLSLLAYTAESTKDWVLYLARVAESLTLHFIDHNVGGHTRVCQKLTLLMLYLYVYGGINGEELLHHS